MSNSYHPFSDLIDIQSDTASDGTSCCRIEAQEKHRNPQHVVHGGVIYSLADTGMGLALYPLLTPEEYCATIEIKMTYFAPVYEGEMVCHTQVIKKGKRIALLESTVMVNDELVAKASGSYSIFKPNHKSTK